MRSTAQLPCADMTKKNDKYALHAKRRITVNGQRLTVSPFAPDKETKDIRDLANTIDRLRKSNDPDDKEILSYFLKSLALTFCFFVGLYETMSKVFPQLLNSL